MSINRLKEELQSMSRFELIAFSIGETTSSIKHVEDGPVKTYLTDYLSTIKDAFENIIKNESETLDENPIKSVDMVLFELKKLEQKLDNKSSEYLLCWSIISSCSIILTSEEKHLIEYAIATSNQCANIKIKVLENIIIRDNIERAISIKEHWRK